MAFFIKTPANLKLFLHTLPSSITILFTYCKSTSYKNSVELRSQLFVQNIHPDFICVNP